MPKSDNNNKDNTNNIKLMQLSASIYILNMSSEPVTAPHNRVNKTPSPLET